jgi:hypothetical protein
MTALAVHGHVISLPSHILFIGRNNRMKALVVIFRDGRKAYAYLLGDSYHPRLCCTLAKHPSPGVFIGNTIKKFPTQEIV